MPPAIYAFFSKAAYFLEIGSNRSKRNTGNQNYPHDSPRDNPLNNNPQRGLGLEKPDPKGTT